MWAGGAGAGAGVAVPGRGTGGRETETADTDDRGRTQDRAAQPEQPNHGSAEASHLLTPR
mgnify:CR=1 FL=1